jgi:hypothetical protein
LVKNWVIDAKNRKILVNTRVAALFDPNILEIGQEDCFDDFKINFEYGSSLVKIRSEKLKILNILATL